MGYFDLADTCCKCNTVERKESRRFLQDQKETFLAQVLIVPHWICTSQTEKDLWVGGQLGHSMINFDVREVRSGDQQKFQRAAFDLFRRLTGALRDISEEQRCLRKLEILQKNKSLKCIQAITMYQKSKGWGRPLARLNREFGRSSRKQREFMTFGKSSRQFRRTTRTLWGYTRRKLEGLKPNCNLIWLLP